MRSLFPVAALAVGCAREPLTCPAKGGHEWRELTTTHFVLRTDLARDDARREITTLENQYAALVRLGFPSVADRPRRAMVVVFSDPEAYRMLGSANGKLRDGWFRLHSANPEWGITGVLPERLPPLGPIVLNGLIAQSLIARRAPLAPPWVYRGLSEVFSRITLSAGYATLGEPRAPIRFDVEHVKPLDHGLEFPGREVVRSAELQTLGFEAFCGDAALAADGMSPTTRWMGSMFGSWILAESLRLGDHAKEFDSYLDRFAAETMAPLDAWKLAFAGREKSIDVRFEQFVREPTKFAVRVAFEPPPVAIDELAMTSAAVHVTWALVRSVADPALRANARYDAKEAVAEAPSAPEPRFALGLVSSAPAERLEHFREALARAPSDPHYIHVLAREYFNQQLERAVADRAWTDVEPLSAKLVPIASSALQFEFLASYALERGQLDEATRFAARAIDVDPGCVPCRETAARVYERRGEWSRAIREQHVAAGLTIREYVACAPVTKRLTALLSRAPKSP